MLCLAKVNLDCLDFPGLWVDSSSLEPLTGCARSGGLSLAASLWHDPTTPADFLCKFCIQFLAQSITVSACLLWTYLFICYFSILWIYLSLTAIWQQSKPLMKCSSLQQPEQWWHHQSWHLQGYPHHRGPRCPKLPILITKSLAWSNSCARV